MCGLEGERKTEVPLCVMAGGGGKKFALVFFVHFCCVHIKQYTQLCTQYDYIIPKIPPKWYVTQTRIQGYTGTPNTPKTLNFS